MFKFILRFCVVTVLALLITIPNARPLSAAKCDNNNTPQKLLACVTLEGVREHQAALQAIANDNGGDRVSSTEGYNDSVDYVVEKLEAAGYEPEVQSFIFTAFVILGPSTLEQTGPGSVLYEEGVDYLVMDQSDAGDVTGPVTAVDIQLGLGNTSNSGCEAEDYDGFPAGNIALVQRGACTFQLKAENAAAAGAVGVIVFNQGNTEDRRGLDAVTLSEAYSGGIPVFFTTYARGEEWAGTEDLVLHMIADTFRGDATTYNVLAETNTGNDDNVVMVGAHLDSVDQGPGMNDNGSGSAAILEVAEQLANITVNNKVRFAWWGAEESGLVGSIEYVNSLSEEELDDIVLYLNFDMVGSPNYVRFVYDGDGTIGPEGPAGSGAIERFFTRFYAKRGLASEPTAFDGRSDYGPFIEAGIPAGGLFTGAEGIKTEDEVEIYGGVAGEQYDPCYHAPCDDFDNVSLEVLDLNADAIAASTLQYAMNTQSVTEGEKSNGDAPKVKDQDRLGPAKQR